MAYLTSGRDKIMGSSVSTDANVVTVIDDTCTDEQVPSALATKVYVDNKEVKISTEENNKIEIKDDGIFVSKDYVEITQAEYDLLTEEEKEDIVFYIKDATGNTELVTVIDENSTDEEIPSAKAVHTAIQNVSAGVPVNAYTKEEVDTLLDDKVNVDDLVESYSKDEMDTLLADKANATDTYNKTEIDALLDGKANTDDVTTNAYTKDEVDDLLANKADSSAIVDAYTKGEVDTLLTTKADTTTLDDYVLSDELDNYALTSSVYNKTEVDDLLTAKVNTTSVVTTLSSTNVDEEIPSAKAVYDAIQNVSVGVPADVYSKTEIDNLLDAKADTDAIIDAYNKTEVDTLLADKANTTDIVDAYTKDEVDNLLTNKADTDDIIDAYTKEEVNTLLNGKANTDDIVDAYTKTEVDDLLADKVNTSNVVLTLSSANTDEEIPSAKAVHTAIQNVSAGVPADVYSKTEVDDLLADKADSTDIIDSYTKEEVDNLLNAKVDTDDVVDAYSKEEVNNLLDAKADTSDIIDAYTKGEVDNLLTGKADTSAIIDAYTKDEVDDLLDSKADSSSIIDAYNKTEVDDLLADKVNVDDLVETYSKTEINGLLADKADSADIVDAYTKGEVDTLLTGKADSDDLNNVYTKEEVNNLLDGKVGTDDVIDAYTKDEVDGLLADKADSTALDSKVNKTAIVTSVSSTSTDAQVPSAKFIYNELDTLNGKVATNTTNIATNTTNIATNTTRIYGIPKRNILINGEFQVNKHKTSVPEGNTTTRYVIDRWATTNSGLYISGNTIGTDAEKEQVHSGYKLRVQVSSSYSGISVYQIIEDAETLYTGKTLTMSFWVKGNYAEGKKIIARIGSGGGNTNEKTVTLTDSWQYVTVTRKDCYFGGRSDGGVVILSYDTFDAYSGFDIACVKLEEGDIATPFEHIPYAEELLMCQKYYMKIDGVNTNSELGLGHFSAISGTTVYPIVYLPTPMRTEPYRSVTPTITFSASGLELYGCNSARTAYEVRPVTNLSIYAIKDNLVTFKCETDGEFALGTSGDFRIKKNGSQYSIELDAELY